MFIEFEETKDNKYEVSIDWGNDEMGIAFHRKENENSLVAISLHAGEADYSNWTPIWKKPIRSAAFDGLIASRTPIKEVTFTIESENYLEPFINSKFVCAVAECNQLIDSCGVCGGDDSSCTYPLCNGFPVRYEEVSSCGFNYFGEGQVSVFIILFSLLPVVLIPVCFCAFLSHQRKKWETERIIQELQDAEEFQTQPEQQETTLQQLYFQYDNNGNWNVAKGEQYAYYQQPQSM